MKAKGTCPQCGALLPDQGSEGLCPTCRTGISFETPAPKLPRAEGRRKNLLFTLASGVGAALVLATSLWLHPKERKLRSSASQDGLARVWDAQSGKPLFYLSNNGGAVSSAWFSPDGKRIVTSSPDGGVRVWEVEKRSQ